MKKTLSSVRNKMIQRYTSINDDKYKSKSTNINVLLNRVRIDKKKERAKKIFFSLSASLGILVFAIIIF